MKNKQLISLVIPAYKEEKNIPLIYKEIQDTLVGIKKYDFEIIFVNDGSPDGTWFEIEKLCISDKKVKGVNLSRNFGKEIALTAWVEKSNWDAVITMDADWQRPAKLIVDLIEKWEVWNQIVYWVRTKMERWFFRLFASNLFNKIMQIISELDFDTAITDFMIIDRKVINYFIKYEDKNRIFRWIILSIGFKQDKIFFEEPARIHWDTWWGFKQLYKLAIDSITSFSLYPLRLIWHVWIFIVISSFCLLNFMIVTRFIMDDPFDITNTAFFVVSNLFLSWVTLCWLWIMAIYIASIHTEVIKKPLYMVSETKNLK